MYGASLPPADIWQRGRTRLFPRHHSPLPERPHSTSHTPTCRQRTRRSTSRGRPPPTSAPASSTTCVGIGDLLRGERHVSGTTFTTGTPGGRGASDPVARPAGANVSSPTYPLAVSPNPSSAPPTTTDLKRAPDRRVDRRCGRATSPARRRATAPTRRRSPVDRTGTWFSWAVENTGDVAVATSFRTRVLVDGEPVDSASTVILFGIVPNAQTTLNAGRTRSRGGRHDRSPGPTRGRGDRRNERVEQPAGAGSSCGSRRTGPQRGLLAARAACALGRLERRVRADPAGRGSTTATATRTHGTPSRALVRALARGRAVGRASRRAQRRRERSRAARRPRARTAGFATPLVSSSRGAEVWTS